MAEDRYKWKIDTIGGGIEPVDKLSDDKLKLYPCRVNAIKNYNNK